MSDVTGPISSLPGTGHAVPDDATCDNHDDRKSVVRIQGETDSFGCEMVDYCQECWDEHLAYRRSPEGKAAEVEWRTGKCAWCKNEATDLRDARDYDEGMHGPVYRVCGACITRRNEEARRELDEYADQYGDDGYDDYDDEPDDPGEECGRWINGALGQQCRLAGSEFCDWECPYSHGRRP